MLVATGQLNEALIVSQKRLSIYKNLNGSDVVDKTLVGFLFDLGLINFRLKKFDDAIEIWKEGEKLIKKVKPDEETKLIEAQLKNAVVTAQKEKGVENQPQEGKTMKQRLAPDTPLKVALWATFFAGIAGITAYVILKKK